MKSRTKIYTFVLGVSLLGCRQDMHDQPKYEAYESSSFFRDGKTSRHEPEGTVARGELNADEAYYLGKEGSEFVSFFPVSVTREVVERGRERYDVFCSPCHDRVGLGNGMIVQRGFKRPPSLHTERLRDVEPGYLFDVITNGYGTMYSYKARIPVKDRWSIVSYIRALQMSQAVPVGFLSPHDLQELGSER